MAPERSEPWADQARTLIRLRARGHRHVAGTDPRRGLRRDTRGLYPGGVAMGWRVTGARAAGIARVEDSHTYVTPKQKPEATPGWPRMLRSAQCAQRAGIAFSTWRSAVSRGEAPPPDGHDDEGRPRWKRSTVDNWRRNMPGRGTRTDLLREVGKK